MAHRQALPAGLRTLARIPGHIGAALLALLARFATWLGRLGLPTWSWRGAVNLSDDPFVDIFARGLDAQLPPAEVIRYVYRAFQVYAARGGHRRRDDQTALEFLHSLPPRLLLPDQAAERLTRAYVLATYSPHEVTPAGRAADLGADEERLKAAQMGNDGDPIDEVMTMRRGKLMLLMLMVSAMGAAMVGSAPAQDEARPRSSVCCG